MLDASGFSRDAMDVAIAGDDHLNADERTRIAFAELLGDAASADRHSAENLRYAMLSIAGGATIDAIRNAVGSSLFEELSAAGSLTSDRARKILSSHFDIEEHEWVEETAGPAVFGSSLINFPKTLRPRRMAKYSPRYNPVSSFGLGR